MAARAEESEAQIPDRGSDVGEGHRNWPTTGPMWEPLAFAETAAQQGFRTTAA
jgi:hypothetical protein